MKSQRRQRGLILASGLLLLTTGMLSMTTIMGIAVRELGRTEIIESLEQARAAAGIGLHSASSGLEPRHTAAAELATGVLANGTRWRVSIRFVGVTARPLEPSLAEWHFMLESEATTPAGARVRERLQLVLPAPPPTDLSLCLTSGCPVPPMCGPPEPLCPQEIRARPEEIAWHLPENG